MKEYTFEQLSKRAQLTAAVEYLRGWLETHPDSDLDISDCYELCLDDKESLYDFDGYVISEEME